MQFTNPATAVTAVLSGTPNVNIANTPDVAVPGGVAVSGNVGVPGGVAVTNTPNVAVPGGVGITGTPNVAVANTPGVTVGTSQPTLNPSSGNTFASREVTCNGVASLHNTASGNGTLIAAPGVGKALELHQWSIAFQALSSTGNGTITLSITETSGPTIGTLAVVIPGTSGTLVQGSVQGDAQGYTTATNKAIGYSSNTLGSFAPTQYNATFGLTYSTVS